MTKLFTLRFKSELPMSAMRERLDAGGFWRWVERDSDSFGEYISTRCLPDFADPDYVVLKIVQEGDHFDLNVRFESEARDADAAFAPLCGRLLQRMLPAIQASDVQRIDDGYH